MKLTVLVGAGFLVLAEFMMAPSVNAVTGVFATRCTVCHQPNGRGIPGVYPPLADTVGAYVRLAEGRRYLIHVLIHGMAGPIVSHGTTYSGLMPPFASLNDATIAATLNHVLLVLNRKKLPRGFRPITPAEVKQARADKLSATEMSHRRARLMKALGATGAPDVARSEAR